MRMHTCIQTYMHNTHTHTHTGLKQEGGTVDDGSPDEAAAGEHTGGRCGQLQVQQRDQDRSAQLAIHWRREPARCVVSLCLWLWLWLWLRLCLCLCVCLWLPLSGARAVHIHIHMYYCSQICWGTRTVRRRVNSMPSSRHSK